MSLAFVSMIATDECYRLPEPAAGPASPPVAEKKRINRARLRRLRVAMRQADEARVTRALWHKAEQRMRCEGSAAVRV